MFERLKAFFANEIPTETGKDADAEYQEYFDEFQTVLKAEHAAINARRTTLSVTAKVQTTSDTTKRGGAQRPMYLASGVALSGGGIRSAAFCLGALQALAVKAANRGPATLSWFDRMDYLSTVSGGGYVGAAVSAAMSQPTNVGQDFPFARITRVDDEPSVGQLRDYSNYLLPRGSKSFADVIGVVLRGLFTNLIFILAGILFFAMLAVLAYPDMKTLALHGSLPFQLISTAVNSLAAMHWMPYFISRWSLQIAGWEWFKNPFPFLATSIAAAALGIYLPVWALLKSRPSFGPAWLRYGLVSDVRSPFVRIAQSLVFAVFWLAVFDCTPFLIHGFIAFPWNPSGLSAKLFAIFPSGAAAIAFFSNKLTAVLKTNAYRSGSGAVSKRAAAKALLYLAAAILPIILWIAYLAISAAGIEHSHIYLPGCSPKGCWLWFQGYSAGFVYFEFWLAFFFLTLAFAPNANSLHQLYRDKLSKAFLWNPDLRATDGPDDGDLVPRDRCLLSSICPPTGGPYHLINAAINLQGSIQANRRGRNASFFLFSREYSGSDPTGYVPTKGLEVAEQHLDLAAAMAISGAAISSNMGSNSVKALSPTLALLNLRLGYWMPNPKYISASGAPKKRLSLDLARTYVFREMFGQLDESDRLVYLTDGGHIENLGLYSLLKRHCSLIIVVDGECDPTLSFRALSLCERYARIDLGVRIDLPWQQIAAIGNAATDLAQHGKPLPPQGGPHCAVGTILYPGGEHGGLVYVKASVTGDEPDFVIDYKQRNPVFPHESTGDQFFTEEQFEVYRALGFHALDGILSDTRAFTVSREVAQRAQAANLKVPAYLQTLLP